LLLNQKVLQDNDVLHGELPPIHVFARILGGKGGFGSLLRGATIRVGQKKTSNFNACRDLNGRRLRHVNTEKAIQQWESEGNQEQKVDHKALRSQYKNIKDDKPLVKEACPWGDKCKYKYKCMKTHPSDNVKPVDLQHLSSHFDRQPVSLATIDSQVSDSVREGILRAKKRKCKEPETKTKLPFKVEPLPAFTLEQSSDDLSELLPPVSSSSSSSSSSSLQPSSSLSSDSTSGASSSSLSALSPASSSSSSSLPTREKRKKKKKPESTPLPDMDVGAIKMKKKRKFETTSPDHVQALELNSSK